MIASLIEILRAFVSVLEWRERNSQVRLIYDINVQLHQARVDYYQLQDGGATGTRLELAKLQITDLESTLASAAKTVDATRGFSSTAGAGNQHP